MQSRINKLPKSFKKFFWDVDFEKIDTPVRYQFVIQRLLDKGDEKAVRWVRANYSDKEVKDTFARLRDFNPKIANFWSLFLNIPKREILCLQTPYLKMRQTHWPY